MNKEKMKRMTTGGGRTSRPLRTCLCPLLCLLGFSDPLVLVQRVLVRVHVVTEAAIATAPSVIEPMCACKMGLSNMSGL